MASARKLGTILFMRTIMQLIVCALALGPALGQHPTPAADEKPLPPDELFANACIGCHVAPDPERATDKAWITQLFDTA